MLKVGGGGGGRISANSDVGMVRVRGFLVALCEFREFRSAQGPEPGRADKYVFKVQQSFGFCGSRETSPIANCLGASLHFLRRHTPARQGAIEGCVTRLFAKLFAIRVCASGTPSAPRLQLSFRNNVGVGVATNNIPLWSRCNYTVVPPKPTSTGFRPHGPQNPILITQAIYEVQMYLGLIIKLPIHSAKHTPNLSSLPAREAWAQDRTKHHVPSIFYRLLHTIFLDFCLELRTIFASNDPSCSAFFALSEPR